MKKLLVLVLFFAFSFSTQNVIGQTVVHDYKSYPYWIEMMNDPDANFYETQKAFYEYWADREQTKGSGYKIFKRWEYWMGRQVDPNGNKPSPFRNVEAIKTMSLKSSSMTRAGSWTSLGPVSVPSGNNGYRGLGRVNAVGFHPIDPLTIYIGAPSGGLWITHDGGTTWETHTDVMPTLGVSAVIIDYTNPDIIYIGTGDRDAGDAPGLGVWKSLDGGLTFQPSNAGMELLTISKLVMHPTDNNIILAATSGGIYRSENGGVSWSRKATGNYKDLVLKPGDPNIVYATQGGVFYRSVNNGQTFTLVSGVASGYRGAIAVSPADPSVVYLLLTNNDSFKGLYRSEDSGLTFSLRSTTPNIMSWDCTGGSGGQAWYDLDIAADPTNANIIHAGGVNCFKSTNGGSTWTINSHWYGGCGVQSVHADLHVLEYNPLNNRLYAGNDGGVYWTANGGSSWTEISNGLVISQAYKIGQSLKIRNNVINGYQDNGTSTYTGTSWLNVGGGDGMECAYDPTDGTYSYSTIYYGSIDRYKNHQYTGNIAGQGVNGINEGGAWVTPFVIDHNDGNTMFIGYDNVWRSTNIKANNAGSVTWTKISNLNVSDFDVLRQSYANTNILYAANGGALYRSDNVKDAVVTWTNLTSALPSIQTITAIETSPVDENVVYVVQQNQVFKSSDRGSTWVSYTGNLPNVMMNTLAYYKGSPEGLYLGTDIGVFYRDQFNPEWISFSEGLPAAIRVTELEIYYDDVNPYNNVIRAGSYGRGLWESQLFFASPVADFKADQVLVPVGCPVNFTDLSVGIPSTWQWSFEGGVPATSTSKNPVGIVWNQEGTYNVTLIVTNQAGIDTITKTAYITTSTSLLPVAEFNSTVHNFCSGDNAIVTFFDSSAFCPIAWEWAFSPATVTYMQGTNANSQSPVVRFDAANNYTVSLNVTNTNGSSTITKENYVVIGGLALPFTENFENDNILSRGWQVVNPDNSITWDIFSIPSDTGVNKVARMNFFNYSAAPGRRDQLISPPVNLKGYQNASLQFRHSYIRRYEGITDSLIIYISDDCGTSWSRLAAFGENGTGNFQTHAIEDVNYVPVSADDWCNAPGNPECNDIDLSPWLGKENVKIMFETLHRRGNNLYLDDITFNTRIGVKENDLPKISGLSIWPNPGNNVFHLQSLKELNNPQVFIYTSSGKAVLKNNLSKGNNWVIQTGKLPAGVYLFRVISTEGTWEEKLIVK